MKILKNLIIAALALGWMGVIIYLSNQPGLQALPLLQKLKILPHIDNARLADDVEYVVRKSAHILEYMILFILVYLVNVKLFIRKENNKRLAKALLFSLFFCIIFACSDEAHQLFVPSRDGRLTDIFIDLFGVMLGQIVVLVGKVLWG